MSGTKLIKLPAGAFRFPVAVRRTAIRLWFWKVLHLVRHIVLRFHLLEKDTCTRVDERYQAHQATGRFLVAAPKNCRQTLVREVNCIWFVISFCVFISSKRIRVLALMNGTKLIKLQAGVL